jgi:hypothetical protein
VTFPSSLNTTGGGSGPLVGVQEEGETIPSTSDGGSSSSKSKGRSIKFVGKDSASSTSSSSSSAAALPMAPPNLSQLKKQNSLTLSGSSGEDTLNAQTKKFLEKYGGEAPASPFAITPQCDVEGLPPFPTSVSVHSSSTSPNPSSSQGNGGGGGGNSVGQLRRGNNSFKMVDDVDGNGGGGGGGGNSVGQLRRGNNSFKMVDDIDGGELNAFSPSASFDVSDMLESDFPTGTNTFNFSFDNSNGMIGGVVNAVGAPPAQVLYGNTNNTTTNNNNNNNYNNGLAMSSSYQQQNDRPSSESSSNNNNSATAAFNHQAQAMPYISHSTSFGFNHLPKIGGSFGSFDLDDTNDMLQEEVIDFFRF